MRTRILTLLALAGTIAFHSTAQSAIDAYNITPTQLRGSARFVAMGGAFTSLGGDLTSMTQNPAGLGIYRSSDIGLTFDISPRKFTSITDAGKYSDSRTPVVFDNFGYVGVANLNGTLSAIQWGFGYNRLASIDRVTSGHNNPTSNSLTNYVAAYTGGIEPSKLLDRGDDFDPYFDTREDWLSILAYNSMLISEVPGTDNAYAGLYQNGTVGDALYNIREKGYMDEYNIDIAGNVSDIVYWGLGVGIIDLDYTRNSYYSENMASALIYDRSSDRLVNGNAGFELSNAHRISGSGANLKAGFIVRPIEPLRIGFAVHTPTWLHLNHTGFGEVSYNYTPDQTTSTRPTESGNSWTPDYDFDSRLTSPWKLMAGISYMIGNRGIISVDYERVAYNSMKMKEEEIDPRGYFTGSFVDNTYANEDIKNYFRAANIFRVGAEFRLNKHVSLRAGYNYQSSTVRDEAKNGSLEIFTNGTDPSYRFDNDTQNICLGLGYRYKAWYIDLAYQHTRQTGTFHAYTDWSGMAGRAPTADVTATHNNIVISTGIRF